MCAQSVLALQQRLMRGRAAKRVMVEHNLRLVASIARKYESSSDVPMSDLVQEGALGLLKGLSKFDLSRGFKFSTYCHWWIRQARSHLRVPRTLAICVLISCRRARRMCANAALSCAAADRQSRAHWARAVRCGCRAISTMACARCAKRRVRWGPRLGASPAWRRYPCTCSGRTARQASPPLAPLRL